MYDPHAHHILYKLGRGAPNRVLGQHGKEALDAVYNGIIEAKNNYESYDELMVRIDKRKEEAQERCSCKKKVGK